MVWRKNSVAIDIVFDGPLAHDMPHFVEVENHWGKHLPSIHISPRDGASACSFSNSQRGFSDLKTLS
jgi:hypothetical protein